MATQLLNILNYATKPDASGTVFFEPMSAVYDTAGNIYDHLICAFLDDGNAARFLYGHFKVPEDFVGSPEFEMVWSTDSATSNSHDFDLGVRVITGDAAETFNVTTDEEAENVTDAVAGSLRSRQVATFTGWTVVVFHTGATCFWRLSRDSLNDSLASTVWLFELRFKYSDA